MLCCNKNESSSLESPDSVQNTLLLNRRGGRVLLHGGYQYHKNKIYANGSSIWQCSMRKKYKCTGSITIQVLWVGIDAYKEMYSHTSWYVSLDSLTFTVSEQAEMTNDVLFLTTLFLTRGNNLRKKIYSIDKVVKTPLLVKIQTCGIKSDSVEEVAKRKRSEKIDMNSKDITLSRVAASFPQIALSVVKFTGVVGKVDLTCMSLQYRLDHGETAEVPAILTHGLIPSLIPKTDKPEFMDLKRFLYFFNIEQSVTLQMPSAKKNVVNEPMTKTFESAERFVNAAINGPLNDDTQRTNLLKHFGLFQPSEDIKRWISVGAKLYGKAALAPSYYMLQSTLSMELANKSAPL